MSARGTADRVRLTTADGVARLTLTRGDKHNAIDPPMLDELLDALSEVRRDEEARTLVIDAEGRQGETRGAYAAGACRSGAVWVNADSGAYADLGIMPMYA